MNTSFFRLATYCAVWFFLNHDLAVSQEKPDDWKIVKLVEQDGFSFRLKYRPEASIADEEWLVLELENVDSPVEFVRHINCRLDYETLPKGHPSGSLGAGMQAYAIFPERHNPYSPPKLEKGKLHQVVEPISNSASASMKYPPPADVDIRGIAHISATMWHGGGTYQIDLRTPPVGIPFEFKWVRPPKSEFDALEQRLRRALNEKTEPRNAREYYYAAARIFEVPQVADRFSTEELTAMFFAGKYGGAVVRILHERDPQNAKIIDWYMEQLALERPNVYAVAHSPFWSPRFVEPLMQILAVEERSYFNEVFRGYEMHKWAARLDWNHPKKYALAVLNDHPKDWQDNPQWSKLVEETKLDRYNRWWYQSLGDAIYKNRWAIALGFASVMATGTFAYKRRRRLKRQQRRTSDVAEPRRASAIDENH